MILIEKIIDKIAAKLTSYKKLHKILACKVEKLKSKEKIKVAFLHMYSSDIQTLSIFENMLNSDLFDPYFIVNPDVSRSKNNFVHNYKKAKTELTEKYGKDRVLDGYNFENNTYIDFTDKFDIATTNNPYDYMTHKFFKIKYWAKKHVPIFYISYFYMGRCFVTIDNLKSLEFSHMWKIFAENKYVYELAQKYETIKGQNVIVTGYPKMDRLHNIKPKLKTRKTVIIAPHHSIDNNKKSVGGFLQYYDYLLELPHRYSDLDFVFRPHPLLLENLKTKYWGPVKTEQFLNKILSSKNVIYSDDGDYFDLFVNSEALIHDCGSFSAEYLYTGKPCAYFIKNGVNPNLVWTNFGKECINCHYLIYDKKDLFNFIEKVVIQGNDYLLEKRLDFADNNVKINYPNATEKIIQNITDAIGLKHD